MRVLFVSLFIVILDQVSKLIVKGFSIPFLHFVYNGMYPGESIQVLGNFFRITFIENPGMAFGFDPGINMKLWISLFSLIASIGLILYLYKIRKQRLRIRIAVAFILGGAVGNLIDRMFYGVFYHYASLFHGRVVDFLDFDFFHFSLFGREFDRWPIFNFADASVTIGVILLLMFYKQHQKSDSVEKDETLAAETGRISSSMNTSTVEGKDGRDSSESLQTEKNNSQNDKSDNGEKISF